LRQEIRVIDISDENMPGFFLLLKMAFQTERRIALVQQALVNRSVRGMTSEATLTHGLMLKNERSALRCVALEAGFVLAQERYAAALQRLLNIRPTAFHCHSHMRVMAISATHFAFQNWVAMWQLEACANVQVTLETGFR